MGIVFQDAEVLEICYTTYHNYTIRLKVVKAVNFMVFYHDF